MKGKTVVITGGTSGIGEIAAERLAAMGARIVLVARNPSRAQETLERLNRYGPEAGHTVHYADLTRLSEMKRVAADIAKAEPRIDVLINNAGAMFGSRKITEDGLESTFTLNHMSYFVVTEELRERLIASAPARIINTASAAHRWASRLDLDNMVTGKRFDATKAYGHSKLCNILFTRELARRLDGTGVTANCLHPGFVATRFGDESGGFLAPLVRVAKFFAISPEEGAETLVYLASSPTVATVSGQFFYKCRPVTPTQAAQDDSAAKALWARSAALAGA
jgi:NAD(P)-dependent dehydrogenase (short-subunit alcohol dehydrogenase family)